MSVIAPVPVPVQLYNRSIYWRRVNPSHIRQFSATAFPQSTAEGKSTQRSASWEHWQTWRSVSLFARMLANARSKTWKQALVAMTMQLETEHRIRDKLIQTVQKSKVKEILHAVTLIIGTYSTWATIGAQYAVVAIQGLVAGALLSYRSTLLNTAQKVAENVARNATAVKNVPTFQLPGVDRLFKVVSAIIIMELIKVVLKDLEKLFQSRGMTVMRERLQNLIGAKLLSQDLETYVCLHTVMKLRFLW